MAREMVRPKMDTQNLSLGKGLERMGSMQQTLRASAGMALDG